MLYVAAEGQGGMRKRIKALRERLGVTTGPFDLIAVGPDLRNDADVADLQREAMAASAEMRAKGFRLGLIVIDTIAAAMSGGDENSGQDMSTVLANARRIGAATGSLAMLIGHTGKNEALGVRGWSGQIGNSDAIIQLAVDEADPTLRVGTVQKLKDAESGERFAYRLETIQMGYDADGDPITSACPVFEDAPTGSAKRKSGPETKPGAVLILRAMHQLIDAGQCESVPAVPGAPAWAKGVRRTSLRERAVSMGYAAPDEKPDTVKRSFNRDLLKLAAAKIIRTEGDVVWPIEKRNGED